MIKIGEFPLTGFANVPIQSDGVRMLFERLMTRVANKHLAGAERKKEDRRIKFE